MERMMNAFWWSSNSSNNKGIKWLSWSRMSMSKKQGGLGFRDLHGFNLALLGKQCWNLLKNPDTLISRLLKARYYPNCSVLQASRTGGSSFTWLGIWEAKEKMKEGLRWVVGDGKAINIYKDKWLRGKPNFCVDQDSNNYTARDSKVCEFFLEGRKAWDEIKVRNSFNSTDAEAILAVQISQSSTSDRVAWIHSSNGQYSVKSGYHYWQSANINDANVQQSDGWGRLWRLCIPHKIRVLLWRICRNNVPVRNQLRGKGVRVPISCIMCTGDIEHLLHLFFDCTFASDCWQLMGMSYDMSEVESAPEWLLHKLSTESSENLIKIATVIWGVWWARNKRVWEEKTMTPSVAMSWSYKQVSDWRKAQNKKNHTQNQLQEDKKNYTNRWMAPEIGSLKLNVDASVFEGAESFSVGMVLRNHQGAFVHGRTMKFAGKVEVLEAELVGILEALKWTSELQGHTIYVESDSLLSVQAIQGKVQNQLEAGVLIDQCRDILNSSEWVSLGFVKKHANRVAHLLARLPCTLNSFIDLSSPPLCVLETIMSDV